MQPSLSDGLLSIALDVAIAAAKATEDDSRLAALVAIAPVLTPELASAALGAALTAEGVWRQDELIIALKPRLSADDLDDVLADARRGGGPAVLAAAAIVVGPAERDELVSEAFGILELRLVSPADAAADVETRCREARTFAELPTELLGRAAELAAAMSPEMAVSLAERLSRAGLEEERENLLRTTVQGIRNWENDYEDEGGVRFKAMATIAPALSRTLRWEALTEAERAGEGRNATDWRAAQLVRRSVRELVPHLDADQLFTALAMVREIRDAADRSAALTGLLPYLSESEHALVLQWSLALTDRIADPYYRRNRISELAPIVPAELFEQLLGLPA